MPSTGSSGGTLVGRQTPGDFSDTVTNISNSKLNETMEKLPFKRYHIFAFANPRSGD
jgi:hypothetical protein